MAEPAMTTPPAQRQNLRVACPLLCPSLHARLRPHAPSSTLVLHSAALAAPVACLAMLLMRPRLRSSATPPSPRWPHAHRVLGDTALATTAACLTALPPARSSAAEGLLALGEDGPLILPSRALEDGDVRQGPEDADDDCERCRSATPLMMMARGSRYAAARSRTTKMRCSWSLLLPHSRSRALQG